MPQRKGRPEGRPFLFPSPSGRRWREAPDEGGAGALRPQVARGFALALTPTPLPEGEGPEQRLPHASGVGAPPHARPWRASRAFSPRRERGSGCSFSPGRRWREAPDEGGAEHCDPRLHEASLWLSPQPLSWRERGLSSGFPTPAAWALHRTRASGAQAARSCPGGRGAAAVPSPPGRRWREAPDEGGAEHCDPRLHEASPWPSPQPLSRREGGSTSAGCCFSWSGAFSAWPWPLQFSDLIVKSSESLPPSRCSRRSGAGMPGAIQAICSLSPSTRETLVASTVLPSTVMFSLPMTR